MAGGYFGGFEVKDRNPNIYQGRDPKKIEKEQDAFIEFVMLFSAVIVGILLGSAIHTLIH